MTGGPTAEYFLHRPGQPEPARGDSQTGCRGDCESVEDLSLVDELTCETVGLLRRLSPASASHTGGTTPVSRNGGTEFSMGDSGNCDQRCLLLGCSALILDSSIAVRSGVCLRPSHRRVAGRLSRGHRADVSAFRARTGGKCAPHYSRLDDLTPVISVATGGERFRQLADNTGSTPLSFSNSTRNFADLVLLAFRPTVCTSLGPS
jgi:hypothetical protein